MNCAFVRLRILFAQMAREDERMKNQFHTLVWIDHRVARMFHFDAETNQTSFVHSENSHQHLHHKANSVDSGHAPLDKQFFERVAKALPSTGPVLIVGPANAKTELHAHLKELHPRIAARISAVDSLDHPSDGALLAHGRQFFGTAERMH
jgi:hypothetical protein